MFKPDNFALHDFQSKLGYFFRDGGLLNTALCHASYAYENGLPHNNERLEFLGDAVLGLITAHALYETYPDADEGELSSLRVKFVSAEALSRWADKMELCRVLLKGKSLKGNTKSSIFADGVEAVIGAVYLDGGLEAASIVVRRYLFDAEAAVEKAADSKTTLQILVQAGKKTLPRYETVSMTGPSHAPCFKVRVHLDGRFWEGEGASRKGAEIDAAARALSDLRSAQ
ncbi:ribonuclease 3 [Synergistales bacterium]|nr:ribonuclease 3 [Synergistales bacterium]